MATKSKKATRKAIPAHCPVIATRTDAGTGSGVPRIEVAGKPGSKLPAIRYTAFCKVLGVLGYSWPAARLLLQDAGIADPSRNTVVSQMNSGKRGNFLKESEISKLEKKGGNPIHHGYADEAHIKAYRPVLAKALTYYADRIAKARAEARKAGI